MAKKKNTKAPSRSKAETARAQRAELERKKREIMLRKQKTALRRRAVVRFFDRLAAVVLFCGFAGAVGHHFLAGRTDIDPMSYRQPIAEVKVTTEPVEEEPTEAPTKPPTEKTYETITVKNANVYKGELMLVNPDHKFEDAKDARIVTLYDVKSDSYSVSGMELGIQEDAAEPLNNMLDDFYEETGHNDIIVVAGFRTLEQQQALYDEDLERTGLDTSTLVAIPGHSEHESGYAVDLSLFFEDGSSGDFDGSGDYAWINENCWNYGYIMRYPEDKNEITTIDFEPWHYRYVGRPHAYYIMQKGICLEEYIEEVSQHDIEDPLEIVDGDGKAYAVYYVPANMSKSVTYLPLISDKPYTISGNNFDGFIVTIDLQETRELVSYTTPPEEVTGITTDIYGNVVTTKPSDTSNTETTTTVNAVG